MDELVEEDVLGPVKDRFADGHSAGTLPVPYPGS